MENYAITISPYPSKVVKGTYMNYKTFFDLDKDEQYTYIRNRVRDSVNKTQSTIYEISEMSIKIKILLYIEFNQKFQMHVHGILQIEPGYMQLFLDNIVSLLGHRDALSNQTLKKACCHIVLMSDVDNFRKEPINNQEHKSWKDYILKEQTQERLYKYPPIKLEQRLIKTIQTHVSRFISDNKLDEFLKPDITDIDKEFAVNCKIYNQTVCALELEFYKVRKLLKQYNKFHFDKMYQKQLQFFNMFKKKFQK